MLVLYTNLKIPGFQAQENIIPFFGESTSSIIVAGIVAIALAPVVEEIFFRGFLLRSLSNQWGTLAGNLITAGIFALFHMQWQNIIPIFILGIIINSITIRSKSIIPSIAFHAFNNAIAFILSVLIIKDVIPIENITS
ncbi:CPBP family intramembrane metalloprotease [Candidatus Peregrinibacteria bacterium]|nr:CPBP family intramembrane metalloprotease [Candidatus Peregrinibacteria bacterium]